MRLLSVTFSIEPLFCLQDIVGLFLSPQYYFENTNRPPSPYLSRSELVLLGDFFKIKISSMALIYLCEKTQRHALKFENKTSLVILSSKVSLVSTLTLQQSSFSFYYFLKFL